MNERKRTVFIATGIGADAQIEVVSDTLAAGDIVVVRGAEILRDGQAVKASE